MESHAFMRWRLATLLTNRCMRVQVVMFLRRWGDDDLRRAFDAWCIVDDSGWATGWATEDEWDTGWATEDELYDSDVGDIA